jgi:hypothetical protein
MDALVTARSGDASPLEMLAHRASKIQARTVVAIANLCRRPATKIAILFHHQTSKMKRKRRRK